MTDEKRGFAMVDIVERLRWRRQMVDRGHGDVQDIPDADCEEAAALIESLREGLKPWADMAAYFDGQPGITDSSKVSRIVVVGDLRTARDLVKEKSS